MYKVIIFLFFFVQTVNAQSGWIQSNLGTVHLTSINFIDENNGYIFTWDYKMYKTTDGGETWQEYTTPDYAFSGNFLNEDVGIFIGAYPYITTDKGSSWNYGSGIDPLPGSSSAAIFLKRGIMLNKDTGYAVGNEFGLMGSQFYVVGKIYRTMDSGQNWELVYLAGFDWTDIKADANHKLYSIQSTFLTSIDYGSTWQYIAGIASAGGFSMSEIFGDTIYISGSTGKITKTFNGGNNWTQYQTSMNDTLNNLFFLNNKTGWVVGDSGYIFHTMDAGTNWAQQNTATTTDINGVYFINQDTGFAVGDNGLFLKTYTGGTVGVQNASSSMPQTYQLYQNYPNPFNPSTVIRFDIVHTSNIKLSIYDLAGKDVAVLVNEPLGIGTYEYDFKAEGLASGVYFYKLEAGTFVDTKRMVLVK